MPISWTAVNSGVLLGLAPWLVMIVAVRSTGVSLASGAILAALTAAVAVVWTRRRRSPALFETVSLVAFLAMVVGAWLAPRSAGPALDHYGRAITAGAMAAIALVSLAFRPITVQYIRDLVPARVLETRAFARASRLDTAVWAATAIAVTASFLLAVGLRSHLDQTIFNWLVPLALIGGCVRVLAWRWAALDSLDESAALVVAALEVPRAGRGQARGAADLGRPTPRLRLVPGERASRQA